MTVIGNCYFVANALGVEPSTRREFDDLLREDVLLRVSSNYYGWRGEEARGQKEKALAQWKTAHSDAERCGFRHLTQRLEKEATTF